MRLKNLKRAISILLIAVLAGPFLPINIFAAAAKETVFIGGASVPQYILEDSQFYVDVANPQLDESANAAYLFHVGRGGDAADAAWVTLKITDITAVYGRDYTLRQADGGDAVAVDDESESVLETILNNEVIENPVMSEEDAAALAEELEAEAAASSEEPEENNVLGAAALAEAIPVAQIGSLESARKLFGAESPVIPMTHSGQDMVQQVAAMNSMMTDALSGASLLIEFAPGENEKRIVIEPIDTHNTQGDTSFMLMLGEHSEGYVNSEMSSAMFGITGSGTQETAVIGFAQAELYAQDGKITVEFTRSGAINTIVAATVRSVAIGDAEIGRDFSPLDAAVVFPFGVTSRTVEIPINNAYISAAARFDIELSEPVNCGLALSRATAVIHPKTPAAQTALAAFAMPLQLMANSDLESRVAEDQDILLKNPVSASGAAYGFEGEGDARHYKLQPEKKPVTKTHEATATWLLGNGELRYDYNGYAIDWEQYATGKKSGINYARNSVYENGPVSYENGYWKDETWARRTNYYYFGQNVKTDKGAVAPTHTGVHHNQDMIAMSSLRPALWSVGGGTLDKVSVQNIYHIYPLLRPFEVSFSQADALEFSTGSGTAEEHKYTQSSFGINKDTSTTMTQVGYAGDQIVVASTVKMLNGRHNDAPVELTKLKAVQLMPPPGNTSEPVTLQTAFNTENSTSSMAFTLDNAFMTKYKDYITYSKNGHTGYSGSFLLKPVYEYRTCEVTFVENTFGTLLVNGVPFDFTGGTVDSNGRRMKTAAYHYGDVLKLSVTVNDPDNYTATGVSLKSLLIDGNTRASEDTIGITQSYPSRDVTLMEAKLTIMPVIDNVEPIAVRIRTSDLSTIDTSYGMVGALIQGGRTYTVSTDPGYTYVMVYRQGGVTANKIYTLSAKAKAGYVLQWSETLNSDVYSGDTFYFKARNTPGDNIVTLRTKEATTVSHTVSGQLMYNNVNLLSSSTGKAQLAASGAIFSIGDGFGTGDADGLFTMSLNAERGAMVRGLIAATGKLNTCNIVLSNTTLDLGTVIVPSDNIDGVNVTRVEVTSQLGVSDMSGIIYLYGAAAQETRLRAEVSDDFPYTDSFGIERKEKITKVEFVIMPPDSMAEVAVIEAQNQNNGYWEALHTFDNDMWMNHMLYVRVTSDRDAGTAEPMLDDDFNPMRDQNGDIIVIGDVAEMVYQPVFSGYTLFKSSSLEPREVSMGLPTHTNFKSLSMIGTISGSFNVGRLNFTVEQLDDFTTRMSFGARITADYNTAKVTTDGGNQSVLSNMKGIITHPINTVSDALTDEFAEVMSDAVIASDTKQKFALGAAPWGISPIVGIYIDFSLRSHDIMQNNPDGTRTYHTVTAGDLLGGGVLLGVNAFFRLNWYALLPIVYIPVYVGVKGDMALYFRGGATRRPDSSMSKESMLYFDYDLYDELAFDFMMVSRNVVEVYAGVGLQFAFGVRGGFKLDLNYVFWPTNDPNYDWAHPGRADQNLINGLKLDFTFNFTVDVLGIGISLWEVPVADARYGGLWEGFFGADEPSTRRLSTAMGDTQMRLRMTEEDETGASSFTANRPMLRGTLSPVQSSTIVQDVYDHPNSQAVELSDGRLLLVYLDKNADRLPLSVPTLYYTIYDGAVWTTPQPVNPGSQTAEFLPCLMKGPLGNIGLVWVSREGAVMSDADLESGNLAPYLRQMEIYGTFWNGTDFDAAQKVTDDSHFNSSPQILVDPISNDRMIFFLKTDLNAEMGISAIDAAQNGSSVWYMYYDAASGKWLDDYEWPAYASWSPAEKEAMKQELGGQRALISEIGGSSPVITDIASITFEDDGGRGKAAFVYTVDSDGSLDTNQDRELYIQLYDFMSHEASKPFRLMNNNVSETLPQLAQRDDNVFLFWLHDDTDLKYYDFRTLATAITQKPDGTIEWDEDGALEPLSVLISKDGDEAGSLSTYQVEVDADGNLYILWAEPVKTTPTEGENFGTPAMEIFATALIVTQIERKTAYCTVCDDVWSCSECDMQEKTIEVYSYSWAAPNQLTTTGQMNDELSAVAFGNDMWVFHNRYDMNIDGPEVDISNLNLVATKFESIGSVEVTDVSFSGTQPGETVTVLAKVYNGGLTAADGYTVTFTAGTTTIHTETVTEKLLPNCADVITFEYTLPQALDGFTITAAAVEHGVSGAAKRFTSEPIRVRAAYTVSDVIAYQNGEAFIAEYTLTNTGNATSAAGDTAEVLFAGPYGTPDKYGLSDEQTVFHSQTVGALAIGESKRYMAELNVPISAMLVHGVLEAAVVVFDDADEKISNAETARLCYVQPVGITINDTKKITITAGESIALHTAFTGSERSQFGGYTAAYGVTDLTIAAVSGNTLTGVNAGTTTLSVMVLPYGGYQEIDVVVTGGSSGTNPPPYIPSGNASQSLPMPSPKPGEIIDVIINGQTVSAVVDENNVLQLIYMENDVVKYADNSGSFTIKTAVYGEMHLSIPTSALGDDDLVIQTTFGTLTVPRAVLKKLGGVLRIVIRQGSFIVALVDEKGSEIPYHDPSNPLRISLPYTLGNGQKAEAVVAVKKDGNVMPYGIYRNGEIAFDIPETGTYDVEYRQKSFPDVVGHWAISYIDFVASRSLYAGNENGAFVPQNPMTRAMFVQVVANLEQADLSAYQLSRFTDVSESAWYAPAIEWAADMGIVSGYGDGLFGPNDEITREQLTVMLHNYIKKKDVALPAKTNLETFADEATISSWALEGLKAVQSYGIITGKPGNVYDPKTSATRAEVATIFARFVEVVAP